MGVGEGVTMGVGVQPQEVSTVFGGLRTLSVGAAACGGALESPLPILAGVFVVGSFGSFGSFGGLPVGRLIPWEARILRTCQATVAKACP